MRLFNAVRQASDLFFERSLENEERYVHQYQADPLVMGDDWRDRSDWFQHHCDTVHLS